MLGLRESDDGWVSEALCDGCRQPLVSTDAIVLWDRSAHDGAVRGVLFACGPDCADRLRAAVTVGAWGDKPFDSYLVGLILATARVDTMHAFLSAVKRWRERSHERPSWKVLVKGEPT